MQGERFANMKYLNDKNIYPLQVKTIEFFRNITALIAALGGFIMAGLCCWTNSRIKSRVAA